MTTMTVKEVIERLEVLRPDALVFVSVATAEGKEVIGTIEGVGNDTFKLVYLEGKEDATATLEKVGQLEPLQPRLDVKPLAEAIAKLVVNGEQREMLEWHSPKRVRLLIGKILPEELPVKQTLERRRKRLWMALVVELEQSGWKWLGQDLFERVEQETDNERADRHAVAAVPDAERTIADDHAVPASHKTASVNTDADTVVKTESELAVSEMMLLPMPPSNSLPWKRRLPRKPLSRKKTAPAC